MGPRLILVVLLAACASPAASSPSDSAAASTSATASTEEFLEGTLTFVPGIADGPGVSVSEAIARAPTELQLANGWLLIEPNGDVWLCTTLTDATPPACQGDRLHVVGYPSQLGDDIQEADDVRWYAQQIQVLGNVTVP
jgi:hypothetical protein